MAKSALNEEEWKDLVHFYHDGHNYGECAIRFGVSKRTVSRHFAKHPEIPRRKPMEAARRETALKCRNPQMLRDFDQKEREAQPQKAGPPPSIRKIVVLEDYENG